MKLLQYGAGNIGRSFTGQLFSRAGYEVVFVDINDELVKALNERSCYKVEVKDVKEEVIWVENVRGVNGKDVAAVAAEIANCDIMATAVGPNALPKIYEPIARGLVERRKLTDKPLDIIICENLPDAADKFKEGLRRYLPGDYPFEELVGLVETSIGKMVPIMPEGVRRSDPLLVYAEAYNELICAKRGFRGEIPDVPGLVAKENMAAYVARKLYIHNLGHALTAYLGFLVNPENVYIWQAIGDVEIRVAVERGMWELGEVLMRRYPDEFNRGNQAEHINDLIRRFGNRMLGDTVYRVGRDLLRKLGSDERLVGALRLAVEYGVLAPYTTLGVAAGILFRGVDERGKLFKRDERFVKEVYPRGIDYVLEKVCGLKADEPMDRRLIGDIKKAYGYLEVRKNNWLGYFNENYAGILGK